MVQYLEKFFRCVCKGKGILYPSKVFLPTKYIFPTREADQILQKSLGEEIASNCSFGSFCRHLSHPIINQPLCSDDDHFISVIQLTALCAARRGKCNLHSISHWFFHLFVPQIYETGELSNSLISHFWFSTSDWRRWLSKRWFIHCWCGKQSRWRFTHLLITRLHCCWVCTAKLLHSN